MIHRWRLAHHQPHDNNSADGWLFVLFIIAVVCWGC